MEELLLSLGLNIASNKIYDIIKSYTPEKRGTKKELVHEIVSLINITNANIIAQKIVNFVAKNGDLIIKGTNVYSSESISIQSSNGTKFVFGDNSVSKTTTSEIYTGNGAFIIGNGGAKIRQNSDGSIDFIV